MGDVALTVPVLREVSRRYPDLNIVMLTRGFYEPFFFDIPRLTVFDLRLNGDHRGISGVYRLYKTLTREYSFDHIIDLNDKLYSKLLRRYFRMSGVSATSIDKGRREKKELTRSCDKRFVQLESSVNRYADCFAQAGFPVDVPSHYTHFDREAPDLVRGGQPLIGIAPFAKHAGKILPLKTVRGVIELISERLPSHKVVIFGGGASEAFLAESLVSWFPNTLSAIGRIRLRQEIDLMANLDLMISMDSSAMHICSLVGTPVISVWGATHHYAGFLGWGQSSDNIVGVDLPCRPCSVYGHKPCLLGDEPYKCLNDITPDQIFDKILALLQSSK